MVTLLDNKPRGTISLDEIKKNIIELQYRFASLTNPEYEIHELYDPNTQTLRSMRLNRIEWWEEWKRQERFLSFAHRLPFKRLGEVRASTDDHCMHQISKVLEDFTTQVDLLSQFLALQAKANAPTQAGPDAYDLPELPAAPIGKGELEDLPALDEEPAAPRSKRHKPAEDTAEEEAGEAEEEDTGTGLEEVDDDEIY